MSSKPIFYNASASDSSDSKSESSYCPRCGREFVCSSDSVEVCQCYGIQLNEEARTYVSRHWQDCLCAGCLKEIQKQYEK